MTIVSSGTISINSLVGEYGGSAPHALTEYYKGGGLVLNHSNNASVPTSTSSGGQIRLSDFYGQSNASPSDYSISITAGQVSVTDKFSTSYYNGVNTTTDQSGSTFGSFSDNSISTSEGTFTVTRIYSVHTASLTITAYVGLSGNHGGGSFESVVGSGYTRWKIGTTTYITDTGNAGAYTSSTNDTRYSLSQTTTMPSSGNHTMTLSNTA